MKMRAVSVLMLFALGGCGFAQKHPAVTIGIVAGSVGFGACGMAVEKLGTCAAIGGGAGLALGGITGLALLLGGDSHELPPFEEEDGVIREGTPPPPGLPIDAGVEAVPVSPPPTIRADAGVASGVDAGIVPAAMDAGIR